MTDHYCEECGRADYDCICNEGKCISCDGKLDKAAIEADRDQCFECYLEEQD